MNSGAVLYVVRADSTGVVTDDAVADALTVSLVRYINGGIDEKATADATGKALWSESPLSVGYPTIDPGSSNFTPPRY